MAKKNGKIFFFKKLGYPKYPENPETHPPESETTVKMKACCEEFEKVFKEKAAAIKAANDKCGTLVPPMELMRAKQTYYYVTEAVEGESLAPGDVCNLSQADRCAIMRDLARRWPHWNPQVSCMGASPRPTSSWSRRTGGSGR
jgi:hypothetical protein